MLTAFNAVSAIGSFRTFIRGLHFFGPSPLGSGSVGVFSAGARIFSAARDPGQPFARDDPHDIGEVRPLVAPPLLDGQIAMTGGLVDGVAGGGHPDARAGRELAKGEGAMPLGPHLVGDQPQDGQLARCELASELRRHGAGRRQRPAPLDRRPPFWRTCGLRLGGKWLGLPCPFACAATCGARCATVSIPRTSRFLASIASASAWACSSVTSFAPHRSQTARANPSSVARDFVPPMAVNKSNSGHSFPVRVDRSTRPEGA